MKGLALTFLLAAPAGSVSAGEPPSHAREVDQASNINYLRQRQDCSEFAHYTDAIKTPLLQLDSYLRNLTQISMTEERSLGAMAMRELPKVLEGRLVSQGNLVDYIRAVAAPMLSQVKRKDIRYQFHVLVGANQVNAFALPGGHIVFTDAILDQWVNNEAQLATILAHEIAHVDERHPVAVIQYLKAMGLNESDFANQLAVYIAKMPYSSALESEADTLGVGLIHQAGYSVFQSVRMWETVAGPQKSSQSEGGFYGALNTVLSEVDNLIASHPDDRKRACALKQEVYDLYKRRPMRRAYVGTTNWRQKVAMGRRVY
jgi:predicted Zn-dependent protease